MTSSYEYDLAHKCINYPQTQGKSIIEFGVVWIWYFDVTKCINYPQTQGKSITEFGRVVDFGTIKVFGCHHGIILSSSHLFQNSKNPYSSLDISAMTSSYE